MALYYNFEVSPEKSVKLKLNMKNIIALEKNLGDKNPLSIFAGIDVENSGMGSLPTFDVVSKVIHFSLQSLEHGYDYNKSCALLDEYLDQTDENGKALHNYTDLVNVVVKVLQVSGVIPADNTEDKNPANTEDMTKKENPTTVSKDI